MRYSNSILSNEKFQTDYEWLQVVINNLGETIRSSEEKFYCQLSTKLANPLRHQKPFD